MRNYDLTVLFDVSKGEDEAKLLEKRLQLLQNQVGLFTVTKI